MTKTYLTVLPTMPLFTERPAQIKLGEHVLIAETDDIIFARVRGVLTGKEARWIQAAMFDHSSQFGSFDFIANVQNLQGLDSEARQVWVHATMPYGIRAMYIVNATFAARTLLWGIYRAGRVLRPEFFRFTMETSATENEARELIRQRRIATANTTR